MKAVVFDFFGVLHDDPLKIWMKNIPENHHSDVLAAARDLDLGVINLAGFLDRLSDISGHHVDSIAEVFGTATVNAEVVELLTQLHNSCPTVLLSNAATDELMPILDKYNLKQHFDHIVISSEINMAKPDPEIFEHVLRLLDVRAGDAVFIDDNPHNVDAAAALGIGAIRFENAEQVKSELEKL